MYTREKNKILPENGGNLPTIEPSEESSVVDEIADSLSLFLFLLEYSGESGDRSSLMSRFRSFLF